ncbi:MAG: D-alanyl-D-alanine carboxypeptidase [Cyanobacteria bacterium RM1_2_2]|nr:D-alanyl-D-alanine carboxypeptidase [Cyanobacteria bacterium RM1_2_2]
MLDLLGGLFSLFFSPTSPQLEPLQLTDWSPWLDPSWVQSITTPSPDPIAQLAVQQHLGALAGLGFPTSGQGVWMQTSNQVLVEHQGTVPLSAASLTKIATTFATLTRLGPNHQFETIFSTTAPIQDGVVAGDLIVQGGGDPLFVWEEGIAVGNALNQAGIRQVKGNLIVTGNFVMNFEEDRQSSANALKQALDANLWSGEIEAQHQKLPPGTARPQVLIQGSVQIGGSSSSANLLPVLRHQSMPLVDLLKAMNVYSNNVMSQMLADAVGGASAVTRQVVELTKISPSEISLINGSGLGMENRLSPRAATTILVATQRYLQARQFTIADVYPILGRDVGTLEGRQTPIGTVVKTGTLNEVSALAGVLPTRDRGLVWFTIINLGGGDIGNFHSQQDLLLQQVQQVWGVASLAAAKPTHPTQNGAAQLGATIRNQPVGSN